MVAGVVSVVAFLVGSDMLVVATIHGVSRRVVATATCEVRTGVTRVVNFGVIVEVKVLEVSWTSAGVWVVAAVDSTALSVSRGTLVVSVSECTLQGLAVDVSLVETISISAAEDVSRGFSEVMVVSVVFVGASDTDVAIVSMDGEAGEISGSSDEGVIVVIE